MKRLVSGIKPTGNLTLGNYIGAIRNFIKMQDDYESYIFVADLHALTTEKIKPSELKKQRESIIALYVLWIRLSKKCNFLSITSSSTRDNAMTLLLWNNPWWIKKNDAI